MRKTSLFIVLMLSVGSSVMANIADGPIIAGKSKSLDTSLFIRIDKNAREAKLVIPRSQLRQLRAELEQLDNGTDDTVAAGSSVTRTQTIVSGSLLSLAFVFGGMWFVRSGSQNSKAVVTAAVLLVFGSIANLVYGNAGPPPEARSITGKLFTQGVHMYKQASGPIKLEVSDKVSNPELIVPDKASVPSE